MLEIISLIAGVLSIYYAILEDKKTFSIGIISHLALIILGFQSSLFGTVLINLIFAISCLGGFFDWKNSSKNIHLDFSTFIKISLSTIIVQILLYYVSPLDSYQTQDLIIALIGFSAMILMIQKNILSWIAWILMDIFYLRFYLQDYPIISLQYAAFIIFAVSGFLQWRKKL